MLVSGWAREAYLEEFGGRIWVSAAVFHVVALMS